MLRGYHTHGSLGLSFNDDIEAGQRISGEYDGERWTVTDVCRYYRLDCPTALLRVAPCVEWHLRERSYVVWGRSVIWHGQDVLSTPQPLTYAWTMCESGGSRCPTLPALTAAQREHVAARLRDGRALEDALFDVTGVPTAGSWDNEPYVQCVARQVRTGTSFGIAEPLCRRAYCRRSNWGWLLLVGVAGYVVWQTT